MCLRAAVESPESVLEKGFFSDYEYIITHNGAGFRCGYVKLEPGHPWHGKPFDDLFPVIVHGRITASEPDISCAGAGKDDGWWIGFDCAHFPHDVPDYSLPMTKEGRWHADTIKDASEMFYTGTQGCPHVWTQDEVRNQCELVAKQAELAAAGSLVI